MFFASKKWVRFSEQFAAISKINVIAEKRLQQRGKKRINERRTTAHILAEKTNGPKYWFFRISCCHSFPSLFRTLAIVVISRFLCCVARMRTHGSFAMNTKCLQSNNQRNEIITSTRLSHWSFWVLYNYAKERVKKRIKRNALKLYYTYLHKLRSILWK